MGSNSGSIQDERLAGQFARLWGIGLPIPDVFDFLATHPPSSPEERLEVLVEDQRQRWFRGHPLPIRVYLSAFPEIADRGDLVRVLVDRERHERRAGAGRLNETLEAPSPSILLSDTPTLAVEIESGHRPHRGRS